LWQREAGSVDLFKYRISAAAEEGFADLITESYRIVALAGFSENLGSVRVCD
jgi:hypothetical protein